MTWLLLWLLSLWGMSFLGFWDTDFSITAVLQVAGTASNPNRAPSLQEQHNFIQLQLKACCHEWSNLLILTGNHLELQERKSHQLFHCENQCLFFQWLPWCVLCGYQILGNEGRHRWLRRLIFTAICLYSAWINSIQMTLRKILIIW